jgi:hypothetical protein
MSNFSKPIASPQQIPHFSADDDEQSFAEYSKQAAGLDLSSALLRGADQSASSQSGNGLQPVLHLVNENHLERSKIRSEIAHLNAGHSDPTMIAVDIREINQEIAVMSLDQQVAMKVEQGGTGAVKQLISAQ